MRLIHPKDKCLHDFVNIQPIHLLENSLDEQNDLTLGFKNKTYNLFISSPGYHQSTLTPLVNLDIFNSFCDFHYESTEQKKDIILRPKFGTYPFQLLLYPLQDMNFKFLYNSEHDISNDSSKSINKKIKYEFKVNSFKKKIKMSPAFIASLQPIDFSISGWLSLSQFNPQVLYKLSFTVGSRPSYVGMSYLNDKDDDDIYEFASRYDNKIIDFRFWISHPTNKSNYDVKSSLEYTNYPYHLFLFSKFNNLGYFKISSKLSHKQKTFELGFDSTKKLKCFFGTNIKNDIFGRIGMTIKPGFNFEHPPLFKACIVFDKSD